MPDIFNEISETLKALGENETISILQKARENKTKPFLVKEFFNIICETIGFKIDHINQLKKKTDERLAIFSFCVYYSYKKLEANVNDVSIGLNIPLISRTTFYKYINIFTKTNFKKPKSNIDKLISENNETIKQKINDFLKNKNNKLN